jgi:predicted HicB family RNase H-like nuclease
MSTMTHKGYAARVDFDDDDGIFFGRIAGIRDGVGFHADTVEGKSLAKWTEEKLKAAAEAEAGRLLT